ncbi:MAG: hypothetical protein KC931_16740, partial [Candidatus Omnitrophica bacterium]|nr:hypothetical protein [Candidatus Omnitrophota bacterium]
DANSFRRFFTVRSHSIHLVLPILFTSIFLSHSTEAAEVSTPFGYKVTVEGEHTEQAENLIVLSKGAKLSIPATDQVLAHELEAYGDQVQVVLDPSGIQQAAGLFALVRTSKDGTETNIPGKLTATRMRIKPEPEMALTYVKGDTTEPQGQNWISESEGIFHLKGKTSVERVHPATDQLPEVLISMSGMNSQVVASSNLATMGWYEGCTANFWQEAYDDLKAKKDALREVQIDRDRVGADAYRSFVRESLAGLDKLGEGYDKLRQRQYTDEVLRRMVAGRADIPRLDLCAFNIIAGESAFTMQVFMNWLGDGRVLSNVAYLTNDDKEGAYPKLTFTLADKSGKIGEDTRLVIADGDAYLETSRPGADSWSMRSTNQFDYLAEVAFNPSDEAMKLDFDLDVTGFLLRKGMRVVGQVNIGSLEVTPNSLKLVYEPSAPSQKVASDFSGYVALSRIILFPDRDRILDDYRPEEISDETWDFFGKAFDYLADGLNRAHVDQVDSLTIEFKQLEGKKWGISADFSGRQGRSGHAEYQAELSENPIDFLWKRLKGSKDATEWLGLDLGFQGTE